MDAVVGWALTRRGRCPCKGRHEDAGTQRDDCMRHGRGLGRDRPADTLISGFPPPGRGHAALCAASSGRPEPTMPAGVRSLRILTCRIRGREEAAGPRPPGLCPGLPHGRHPALTSKQCTSEGVPRTVPSASRQCVLWRPLTELPQLRQPPRKEVESQAARTRGPGATLADRTSAFCSPSRAPGIRAGWRWRRQ